MNLQHCYMILFCLYLQSETSFAEEDTFESMLPVIHTATDDWLAHVRRLNGEFSSNEETYISTTDVVLQEFSRVENATAHNVLRTREKLLKNVQSLKTLNTGDSSCLDSVQIEAEEFLRQQEKKLESFNYGGYRDHMLTEERSYVQYNDELERFYNNEYPFQDLCDTTCVKAECCNALLKTRRDTTKTILDQKQSIMQSAYSINIGIYESLIHDADTTTYANLQRKLFNCAIGLLESKRDS